MTPENIRRLYDEWAPGYNRHYGTRQCRAEDLALSDLLTRLLRGKAQGTILDLGCGTGLVKRLPIFADPKWSYVGVDASPGMLAHAAVQEGAKVTLVVGDIQDLHYPPEHDVVISTYGALSYCAEVQQVLAGAYAALKPGGLAFFMPYSQHQEDTGRYPTLCDGTVKGWWPESFEDILVAAGFSAVASVTWGSGRTRMLTRILPPERVAKGLIREILNPSCVQTPWFLAGWGRK